MLKINVNSITADPESFSTEVNKAAWDLGPEAQLLAPVQVVFKIHRIGEKIYIDGQATTQVALTCARCLDGYHHPLHIRFMLLAIPGAEDDTQSGENDQPPEDEDPTLVYYTGDQLDLLSEVRSALLLALPMKPLCAENCPGLCPHCGARLADGPCTCDETPHQGPFSVLKDIKT